MAILGNWVCISGVRRTAVGWVHDLSVKVDAHAGIDRVEFAVVANGTPWDTLTAVRAEFRTPNYGDSPSPLPGVASGMAPFWGWGVGLDLADAPAGTLVVTATVFDTLGNSRVLADTMTVYNDTDGTDRRPRTVTVYADGTDGSDANNGTSWALAVKTLGRARSLARSGAGDVSGARILCRGTFTDIGGGQFPQCSTSGAWWCEFVADSGGAYLNPPEGGSRAISSGISGTSSSTVICRNRFVGFRFGSASVTSFTWGGTVWNWFDGCWQQGADWVAGRSSVLYADPARGVQGYFVGWDGSPAATAGLRFFSGCYIRGAVLGFEPSRLCYDCRVDDFTGISQKVGAAAPTSVVGAFVMKGERYAPRVVHGFVRMDSDPVQGKGRPALTVTKPTGTTARITGPVSGYDFSLDADDLVGNTYWGLRFQGSGATGLDTGVGLLVTAVGNTGGAPWVEVTAPGASAGSISANTCSFYTARVATGMNYWNIHPDGIQIERNLALGDAIFDCALVDAPDLQSYFTSGNDGDKVLIENIRDDGSGLNVMNFFGADFTDSILQRIVSVGQFQNSGGASGWAGTIIRNCVFGSLGGDASTIPSRGGTVSYCHVISGSAWGSNSTTGSWFAGTPTVSPFSFEPDSGRLGTGTTDLEDPAEWAYSGSGSTRGVLRNVGELDWSLGGPAVTVVTYDHSAHASPRYTATVDGDPLPIWARTTDTQGTTPYWLGGANVDQSGATFGADGSVAIVVSLVSGSITSAVVYTNDPSGVVIPSTVSGGTLSFGLPNGMTAWCEINGLRGQPLILRNLPLVTQPTGGTVDIYNGSQTTAVAGRTLVFPAGTHTIGRSFPVPAGARVWLHGGAWVIGAFHNQGTAGDHEEGGHGILSGEWGSSLRATIRALPTHDEMVTYSLIYGEFAITAPSRVWGITLLDPPFYSTYFGVSQVEDVMIVGPWWGNSDAFNIAQQGPSRVGHVKRSCAWIHDNVIFLEEYLGRHIYDDNIVGSVASSAVHISFWPLPEVTTDTHSGTNNTIVCFFATAGIVKAWCDGSDTAHVVRGGNLTGLRFVGPIIYNRAFWLENRLYPIEWGPQALGLGQITEWTFSNVTFEVVPTQKSIIKGINSANAPSKIAFNNVWYATTRMTAANFLDYFEIDEFVTDITVDGVRVDLIRTTGSANVAVGASGTSGLQIVSVGGASVSISAAGAAALQVGAVGSATIPIAASGFSTVGVVVPSTPPPPTNAPRGAVVAPSTRLRRRRWWTWLNPW